MGLNGSRPVWLTMKNDADPVVEDLRRRAKDNKSDNVKYFLDKSFEVQQSLRGLLATTAIAALGLITAEVFIVVNKGTISGLIYSLILGILGYLSTSFAFSAEAQYYSKIEKIFSVAFPTPSEYEQMLQDENLEKEKRKNKYWAISLILLLSQSALLILSLYKFNC